MTGTHSSWKARLLGSLVVVVGLWPIAHYVLVTRLDVNPWKLYGFAMYCTPHVVEVELYGRQGERIRRIESRTLPPEIREGYRAFLLRRWVLGRLHSPEPVARSLLETWPQLESVEVRVHLERLQPMGDSIMRRSRVYDFARDSE